MANPSTLLTLPRELRGQIYSYVFPRLGLEELADGTFHFCSEETTRDLYRLLHVNRLIRTEAHQDSAEQTNTLLRSHPFGSERTTWVPYNPTIAPVFFRNIQIFLFNGDLDLPTYTHLMPELKTMVEARLTFRVAQSRSVPMKTSIITDAKRQYLMPGGYMYNRSCVHQLFGNGAQTTRTWKIWVRLGYLAFTEGSTPSLPGTTHEWERCAADMEWLEEIWVCLDDEKLVSRHHTGDELRRNGAGPWIHKFHDFWYDTLVRDIESAEDNHYDRL